MKVVAVAGGEGTRLQPLTLERPKPLVPMVNRPVLVHMVQQLRQYGLSELRVTLRYMASLIEDVFKGELFDDLDTTCIVEEKPLGTAGSLKTAVADWDEPFMVVTGDCVTDFDFRRLYEQHCSSDAEVTIALHRVEGAHEYGVVLQDETQRIYDFVEKPRPAEQQSDAVNTGIYVLDPSVLDFVPHNREFDFSSDLFPSMLRQGRVIRGVTLDGYWCDIGNTEQYVAATQEILSGRVGLLENIGEEIRPGIWTGRNVTIHNTAQLTGPVFLGDGVHVNAHSTVIGPSVIRPSTIVDSHAQVEQSVIWRNSYIGPSSHVRGAIICRQASIKAHAHVAEGCVVGDSSVLEEGVILMPGVKLWPHKRVLRGTTVRNNVIWGRQERQELFRGYTISGQANLDLTPEAAARIGVALGTTLDPGVSVAVNRDAHRASRMIKRGLVSGLLSSGVNVLDMGNVAVPVLRHFVRHNADVQAGGNVRVHPDDPHPQTLMVQLLEGDGSNLGKSMERKVQTSYAQEAFRRAGMGDLGGIEYARGFVSAYVDDFLSKVNAELLERQPFKLVVDYSNGRAAEVMSRILNRLHIENVPLNTLEQDEQVDRLRLDRQQTEMGSIVKAVKADLGVIFDVSGEVMHLVDEQGTRLSPIICDALFLDLALHHHPYSQVVYPDHMPQAYDRIVSRYHSTVLRTKSDMHNLMASAGQGNVLVALNGRGNFIFPFFHPAPDPMMALLKLVEYLAARGESISRVLSGLPDMHYQQGLVEMNWMARSRVMSELNSRFKQQRVETLEGLKVKLGEDEWVQMKPSPVNAAIDVTVDTLSADRTGFLLDRMKQQIQTLIPEEEPV